ncbi:MAG: hypothetical protein ABI810_01040, partial [Sphingomonas bacterium]
RGLDEQKHIAGLSDPIVERDVDREAHDESCREANQFLEMKKGPAGFPAGPLFEAIRPRSSSGCRTDAG